MDISHDDFIRTTEPRHVKAVQKIFRKLYDSGTYTELLRGWYCTPCEAFWTEHQLNDGNAPTAAGKWNWHREERIFSAFPPTRIGL